MASTPQTGHVALGRIFGGLLVALPIPGCHRDCPDVEQEVQLCVSEAADGSFVESEAILAVLAEPVSGASSCVLPESPLPTRRYGVEGADGSQRNLVMTVPEDTPELEPGDEVTYSSGTSLRFGGPTERYTSLHRAGDLFLHLASGSKASEVPLPEGFDARQLDAIGKESGACGDYECFAVEVTHAGDGASLEPGESATLGGLRVYLDDADRLLESIAGCDVRGRVALSIVRVSPFDR